MCEFTRESLDPLLNVVYGRMVLISLLTEEHGLRQDARADFMRTIICRKGMSGNLLTRHAESIGMRNLKSGGGSWAMCFDVTTGAFSETA